MPYCIFELTFNHDAVNKDRKYQIPDDGVFGAKPINDEYWFKEKPTEGADVNTAYKRLEQLHLAHADCKCKFEVIEI